jgi:hypothetical protein
MENFYTLFNDRKETTNDFDSLNNLSIDTLRSGSSSDKLYYDKKKFDFKQVEDIVNSQHPNSFSSEKELLEHFAEIENIILLKIKINHDNISKFYHKILKDMAYTSLENKFKEHHKFIEIYKQIKNITLEFFETFYKKENSIDYLEGEEQIIKLLNENQLLDRPSTISFNLKKFHQDDKEIVSEILSLLKKVHKKNVDILIQKIKKHYNVSSFPKFLVRTAKYKIQKKINKKYLPKFKEIFLRNNFLNSFEYLIILDKIKEISSNKLDIFDDKILPLEFREIILKIILIITHNVFKNIKKDFYYSRLFEKNIQKYFTSLNTNIKYENMTSGSFNDLPFNLSNLSPNFNFLSNKKNDSKNLLTSKRVTVENILPNSVSINVGSSKNILEENKSLSSEKQHENLNIDSMFSQIGDSEEILIDLYKTLEALLNNNIEKYLFVILSLTLLFNNYDLANKSISYTSARERECLRQILTALNQHCRYENFDAWKFNQILESVLFSIFFKQMYSKNLLKKEKLQSEENQNFPQIDKSHFKYKILFDQIDSIIKIQGSKTAEELLKDYDFLIQNIPKRQKKNCCQETWDFFKTFFFPYEEKEVFVSLNKTSLNPYDRFNHSNQVCILIPGYMSQNHNNHKQWENFIIDFDIYVDFYFYTWDSKTGVKVINDIMKFIGGMALTLFTRNFLKVFGAYRTYQHKNNLFARTIQVSKYFGKLLAYILATQVFFEKRTISLVGFSLGGHILKHCLKELFTISEYLPQVKDIIQNIIFIGAATSIDSNKKNWERLPEFVSGRIINCYSPNDEVLQGIFKYITKKDSLGIVPFNLVKNQHNFVENYDFGDWNIKHVEYKIYFNEILKKIKLFH